MATEDSNLCVKINVEDVVHPRHKLASVTRKRNEIENLLSDDPIDVVVVKTLYTQYLVRVEVLLGACSSNYSEWLQPHQEEIKKFRTRIESIIYPKAPVASVSALSSRSSLSTGNSSSCRSAGSVMSARVKIIQKKAKLEAKKAASVKIKALEQQQLMLRQEKEKIETEQEENEIKLIEEELSKIDVCSVGERCDPMLEDPMPQRQTIENDPDLHMGHPSRLHVMLPAAPEVQPIAPNPSNGHDDRLIQILHRQNEMTFAMNQSHLQTSLPKRDFEAFDGEDITKYKIFIINFERIIVGNCNTDSDKLIYLQQYTLGKAYKLVTSCSHLDPTLGYHKARHLLDNEYGNEYKVASAYIKKLHLWPPIKSENADELYDLAMYLMNIYHYLETMSYTNQLQSPEELMKIVKKLPYKLRDRWRRRCHSLLTKFNCVEFKNLVDFVQEEAAVLKHPWFSDISEGDARDSGRQFDRSKKSLATAAEVQSDDESVVSSSALATQSDVLEKRKSCEHCNSIDHNINTCTSFDQLSAEEKSQFVRSSRLCFGCLRPNHMSKHCKKRSTCDVCKLKHPTILHDSSRAKPPPAGDSAETPVAKKQTCEVETQTLFTNRVSGVGKSSQKILSPVLPVKVKLENCNKEITINCVLDNCSTDCWARETLLSKLGVKLNDNKLSLTTMHSKKTTISTKVLNNLIVSEFDNNFSVKIPVVFTKPSESWPFGRDDLITAEDVNQYEHLAEVPFNIIDEDIELLIGMNIPSIMKPIRVVDGESSEPYASLHSLGWTLNGPVVRQSHKNICNRAVVDSETIDDQIERFLSQDFQDSSIEKVLSADDRKWMETVDSSTRKLSSKHYEIDLPFKTEPNFPSNKQQAHNRFLNTLSRINKNEDLGRDYRNFMTTMIDNNFMEKVPENELQTEVGRSWYLSHHAVYHKQKKKIRIVFNCSAKFEGVSLNDLLWQGPDLANNLVGVLLRFRQEPVAVVGDITKMYYQVRVNKKHADFLRLFWLDDHDNITEYRLLVHVFGATSSPSVANFALKKTASDVPNCSSKAKEGILKNFYVDDLLVSEETEERATTLVREIRDVVSQGGFVLTSFNSNRASVLKSLCDASDSDDHDIRGDSTDEGRALGVSWRIKEDNFCFKVAVSEEKTVTKRSVLRNVASIYDPIGFCLPVLIPAKKVFQESCRLKLQWDDPLPRHLLKIWNECLENIKELSNYKIPRCMKLPLPTAKIFLHVFVDGSEAAYGAVSYLQFLYTNEKLSTALVASKSRLAPLNNSTLKTIPRIELCSAKLGVELYKKLKSELTYNIDDVFFWSDSVTVLRYIKNEEKRYQRFVDNKVSFIRNFTKPSQWYFIPTSENPGDFTSRGTEAKTLIQSELWNYGPRFLIEGKSFPEQTFNLELSAGAETKDETKILACHSTAEDPVNTIMSSVSSWWKLKVRVANILMLRLALKEKTGIKNRQVSVEDLITAENEIIKYVQNKHFFHDIQRLKNNQNVTKSSVLRKLSPFIDDGILRVGGRIGKSNENFEVKHPIIFPKDSPVTVLLVRKVHQSVGHLGRKSILSSLREKYWVINGDSVARRITRECIFCRKYHGKPSQQIMAELPAERVRGDEKPFTHIGVDFFGPFIVSIGRRTDKRYGVIFSCMSSRAVHLEVSESLSTDSFVNAFRRFVSRRGNVVSVTSDNGTNFVSGNKELQQGVKEWNIAHTENWLKQRGITWKFNPPSGSHFGGFYEREIRTIRQVLTALFTEQHLKMNTENLSTLLCEVEAILNGRPLTEISSDPNDITALTPNHLLLFSSGVTFPPGLFDRGDCYVRRRWRQTQYLVQQFWLKWRKNYLILLQEKQKWFNRKPSHQTGDLVLIVDNQTPRNYWSLGRITKVFADSTGNVRRALVKTSRCRDSNMSNFNTSVYERPISKLILLRSSDNF